MLSTKRKYSCPAFTPATPSTSSSSAIGRNDDSRGKRSAFSSCSSVRLDVALPPAAPNAIGAISPEGGTSPTSRWRIERTRTTRLRAAMKVGTRKEIVRNHVRLRRCAELRFATLGLLGAPASMAYSSQMLRTDADLRSAEVAYSGPRRTSMGGEDRSEEMLEDSDYLSRVGEPERTTKRDAWSDDREQASDVAPPASTVYNSKSGRTRRDDGPTTASTMRREGRDSGTANPSSFVEVVGDRFGPQRGGGPSYYAGPVSMTQVQTETDAALGGLDHTSDIGATVEPFSGAPTCILAPQDPYSCAFTEAEQALVSYHLERRAMVAFMMLLGLALVVWAAKSIFESVQRQFRNIRYINVMFLKGIEQMTILGFVSALLFLFSSVSLERRLDRYFFPEKDHTKWDLTRYASNDIREGLIAPEFSTMLRDLIVFLTVLIFIYIGCLTMIGLHLTFRFRKWHRFECEAENEVHVDDNPVEKVSFLLWRRSMVTPMLGHRPEELNCLRNPLQEFSFVHYLQEVLAQYMQSLFRIPTWGLGLLIFISAVDCFLEMETISRTHHAALIGLSTCTWSWVLLAVLAVFYIHLQRIVQMLTPPPAAMLWHLDPTTTGRLPHRHLLPPFRLVPYLKEAPKKTKFFYWWYGTFSPNQQEQLFFRWRKGPSTILQVLQIAIFLYAAFIGVLLRSFSFVANYEQGSLWYSIVGWTAAAIAVFYIIPECVLLLLISSTIHLMPNKRAIHAVVKEHSQEHHNLSTQLLEMAQIAAMKERLENPDLVEEFHEYLEDLYEVIFSQDQKDLFEAGWKIHNWSASRGMNPTELKECMEHLGFDDSEIVIGEWWLVFDSTGEGCLHHDDFKRMLTARHVIKYGQISKDDLVSLFEVHPNGEHVDEYTREKLSEYLVSFRIEEPRLGALILVREARFLADERAGMVDHEIISRMAANFEAITVTPEELAEFLYMKQNFRTRFDGSFIDHMRDLRAAERERSLAGGIGTSERDSEQSGGRGSTMQSTEGGRGRSTARDFGSGAVGGGEAARERLLPP
ncbi:unnamed protein product [Amoebophrya sp. A25]|nr:unnamed protein product [Amoebophrya sp. A25]|eukprot:GSA25T00000313001.1